MSEIKNRLGQNEKLMAQWMWFAIKRDNIRNESKEPSP